MSASTYDFANMTKAQTLDARVDLDVRKWGEGERAASRKQHANTSRGLLINAIVHHSLHEYGDAFDASAKKIAAEQLTAEDKSELRKGG